LLTVSIIKSIKVVGCCEAFVSPFSVSSGLGGEGETGCTVRLPFKKPCSVKPMQKEEEEYESYIQKQANKIANYNTD
jgi:hypothetical protein